MEFAASQLKTVPFPKRKKERKPFKVVKSGAIAIPIYKMQGGRYCAAWTRNKGAKRERITSVDLDTLVEEVERKAIEIANGRAAADELTPEQRRVAQSVERILAPIGHPEAVAREVAEVHKLTGGAGLLEIGRFFARHHSAALADKTVNQAHADLLLAKSDASLSKMHRQALELDLGHFVKAFHGRMIAEIAAAEIREHLRRHQAAHAVGWRRRNNIRDIIVTFFRFAKSEGYLPQDRDTEAEKVEKLPRPRDVSMPEIFTPEEMRMLLNAVSDKWKPALIIGAFAGLRSEERQRLVWEKHVLWEEKVIFVDESVAKHTRRRRGDVRYVPMRPNLIAWLRPYMTRTGPVCTLKRWHKQTEQLAKVLPEKRWRKNALRRSWISYGEAERPLAEVAGEAGNSASTAKRCYLNPRLVKQAKAYFGIYPVTEPGAGIIEFPFAAGVI